MSAATLKKMADINLDALRAARAESAGDRISISLGDKTFSAPRELPYEVLRRVKADDLDGALVCLLGEKGAEDLLSDPSLTIQDVNALLEGIVGAATGAPMGEPSGSSRS